MSFVTLKDLYDKLMTIEVLKDKIKLYENKIEIIFHEDYILSITLNIYFNIFINNICYSKNIENQDIWEIIHFYLQTDIVFVEYDGLFKKKENFRI